MIKFDCFESEYKSPVGAIRCGGKVSFRVEVDDGGQIAYIVLVMRSDSKTLRFLLRREEGGVFCGDIELSESGFYHYRFELVRHDGGMYFAGTTDGHTAVIGDWLPEWRVFAYEGDFETPDGFEGGVMYQIFPDRFYRADDGGALPQTKNERIVHENWYDTPYTAADRRDYRCNDYFCGNLRGIEQKLPYLHTLGVSHIYLNPIFESSENHRYSTADYMNIDPYLGNDSDFSSLCRAAADYNIKIILDGVFSHTGCDSIYFNRYGSYPSLGAYQSRKSPYFNWYRFYDYPDGYDCWWGFKTLPNVNEENADYAEFITGKDGVLRHWMRLGASGWRLDVADELPDGFLEKVRDAVKAENSEAVIIGEVWENAVTKSSYGAQRNFLRGGQCDTVMNYPFMNAVTDFMLKGDAQAFYMSVMEIVNDYPAPALRCVMNMLSTHDTERILTRLDGNELLFMSAAVLQYTLPGIPCVFYGDEAGLCGGRDPLCRGTYPWGKENGKLLNFHKKLGIIRKKYARDLSDNIKFNRRSDGVIAFSRGGLTVIANMSENTLDMPEDCRPLISSAGDGSCIPPRCAVIYRRSGNGKDTFGL